MVSFVYMYVLIYVCISRLVYTSSVSSWLFNILKYIELELELEPTLVYSMVIVSIVSVVSVIGIYEQVVVIVDIEVKINVSVGDTMVVCITIIFVK